MKKLLALVLALVMTLSLCTVTNAAYPDDAAIDYDEAVAVMSSVGVFKGDEKGNFNPDANLTRETAAKLIAYLDLGEKVAEALPAVKVFSDVEANRWSAKYVAYCADAGYIAGVGDGTYNPTGELTGYAFGKLLLCVLGYDANIEGFTGANWSINVAKFMQSNDIAKGVDKAASAVLTREEAAQYCLNALKADCVKYDNGGTTITTGDVTITTGASKAETVANTVADDYRATGTDAVQQLIEKLYPKMKLVAGDDDFNRPATMWKNDTKDVYTVVEEADAVIYGAFTAKDLYNALGKVEDATITWKANGTHAQETGFDVVKTATTDLVTNDNTASYIYYTAKTNSDPAKIDIYEIRYAAGKVTKVTAAKYDKDGEVTAEAKITLGAAGDYETTEFAKDDVVVYAKMSGKIVDVLACESVEGKVASVKSDAMSIDGRKYYVADCATAAAAALGVSSEGTYYLGVDGTIVDFKGVTTTSNTYAYVYSVKYETGTNADGLVDAATITAYVVLDDGTKASYVVTDDMATALGIADETDAGTFNSGNGKIVCYVIEDGKLDAAAQATGWGIQAMAASVDMEKADMIGSKYASSKTNYVFAKIDTVKKTVTASTVVGYKNVDQTSTAGYVYDKDANVVTVFVKAGAASLTTDNLVAIMLDNEPVVTKVDTKYQYAYSVAIDGKETTLVVEKNSLTTTALDAINNGVAFEYELTGEFVTESAVGAVTMTPGKVTSVKTDYYVVNDAADGTGTDAIKYVISDAEIYLVEIDDDGIASVSETTLAEDDVLAYTVVASGDDAGKIDFALVTRAD